MANRKENLKSLFSNTRTRVIIVFTAILLILTIVVGYVKLRHSTAGPAGSSALPQGPVGIQSIPGVLEQTAQYAKLQQQQNENQATHAQQSGSSAIPTIIRTQALGEGVGVVGSTNGHAGVGFTALAHDEGGSHNSSWIQALKNGNCSKNTIDQIVSQGAQLADLKEACTCIQLKDVGYPLPDLNKVCECKDLKAAGYNARQLKDIGYTAERLRDCGFDACELRNAGFTAQEMKDGGFSDGELKGAGFSDDEIARASGLPDGMSVADILKAGCSEAALARLRKEGVSASVIRRISGCSPNQLKAAGYTDQDLKAAGFTSAEITGGKPGNCDVETLKRKKAAGVSAATIRQQFGCSARSLNDAGYSAKDLKAAGFTAAELKAAGFSAKDLKNAGFTAKELMDAGFSPAELKTAGFSAAPLKALGISAKNLKDAGFSAGELKAVGFGLKELKDAGLSASQLKLAGYTAKDLKDAGFTDQELKEAGFVELQPPPSNLYGLPAPGTTPVVVSNDDQLQAILNRQNEEQAEQKYQQNIQQKTSDMLNAANQAIQNWRQVNTQVYTEGEAEEIEKESAQNGRVSTTMVNNNENINVTNVQQGAIIKTGDVLFAVVDTSINSDEPGPILATIVSGKLKGTKLIGSFNLPSNANHMVITFNTMSVPGAVRTTNISAYAIDPNTARTALSSRTNHHYLMRYGSLFASAFLQGFGNAFQSANTTVTIGGTGGGNNVTISNGVGRSALENAIIGLAQVGQNWSQQAQQIFNTPITVEVYSGTGIGVLFTQDVQTI